jgi:CubicO group peptidase (beta-lactamase class C family)
MRVWLSAILLSSLLSASAINARAEVAAALPPAIRENIDQIARQILSETGVPSASIAVVREGQTAYLQTYGNARLEPLTPASREMRYDIGSISKQFTAAALLMLAGDGKLLLDDPVASFLPGLTDANRVTLRQLLSHTSGYRDYWPQDYVPRRILEPVSGQEILDGWARGPLDFAPGTKWEYSNTNYVIAGMIVEKISGLSLFDFLRLRIFQPLKMTSAYDTNSAPLQRTDAQGFRRFALGPLRPAPKEGKGWLFGAGGLAMSAADLARWDISLMNESLMKTESYREMETPARLTSGEPTAYGLGVAISNSGQHLVLQHGGEVSGFTAENIVLPKDRLAVVVLTNQDATTAASRIGQRIAALLLQPAAAPGSSKEQQMRAIFRELQRGKIDRSLFTANANAYFDSQTLADYASSLGPLGEPQSFILAQTENRGGMVYRSFRVLLAEKNLLVSTYELPDGKIEQYMVTAQ